MIFKNVQIKFVGGAFIGENGSCGYEVHVKDIDGYEQTIYGPGLSRKEAEELTAKFNSALDVVTHITLERPDYNGVMAQW